MMRFIQLSHLLLWLLLVSQTSFAYAQISEREYALKAGFLYNFARYSQGSWFNPKNTDEFVLCSSDAGFIDISTKSLKDRRVHGIPVQHKLVSPEDKALSQCNALFITSRQFGLWQNHLIGQQLSSTMIVGENNDFLATGGHINFFLASGKVRFEVNVTKLKSSGIQLSSKVLRLGRVRNEKSRS